MEYQLVSRALGKRDLFYCNKIVLCENETLCNRNKQTKQKIMASIAIR